MPTLRVVSYNVHSLRDDRGALHSAIRSLAPDVLIVQEAPRRFRWRQRCAELARSVQMFYAVGGLPSLGNLILTSLRVNVHDTWTMQFPLTPGRHLRGAAFARCTLDREPFVVAGSHLATDPVERPGQATLLKKALSDLDVPLVLGADLNEGAVGTAWRTVAAGLTDAADAAGGADRHTFSCADPRDRIDALLVDPRFTVVGYDVVDSELTRRASDHFPVVADLSL